ncbi:MAG: methyltransferase [Oscillospiraceae bacterium]|nr:methyltransferase [Oscillospiraceae bacterium]
MNTELLNGWLRLPRDEGFPLGTDAVVLADFARPPRGSAVCDLCAGSGAVGLQLAARDRSLRLTAVELRAEACATLERTAEDNAITDRVRVLQGDLREIRTLLLAGSFAQLTCNPPYYPVGSGFVPKNEAQTIARTERCCTIEDVCKAAAWLLRTGGCLWMVHRPERLTDLLCSLRANKLEPKRLRLVCPRPGAAPSLLLIQAVRGGKPGLGWNPPLLLANEDGSPSEEYRRIYRLNKTEESETLEEL